MHLTSKLNFSKHNDAVDWVPSFSLYFSDVLTKSVMSLVQRICLIHTGYLLLF